MPRRTFEDDPPQHERWLVSYADFITLLFAFFVVMYAASSVNQGKYRRLVQTLGSAFGQVPSQAPGLPMAGEPALPAHRVQPAGRQRAAEAALKRERERLTAIARDLQRALAPLVEQGKVRVTQSPHGVSVEIPASVLFASGDAALSSQCGQTLKAVAQALKDDTHLIQVEGHTDSMPIENRRFPSNWELSAVRAGSVVRLFIENGIAESRLTAVGRGPTKPVAANDTAEGRLRNRRVAVMILSDLPEEVTEVPVERDAGEVGGALKLPYSAIS